ncbi:ATP-binding protein [Saccharothrix sp. NPDC042600]|uniref:ATP-dependent nuclease n=1 Tax=Saccharothrix TaxID=2071 RepID=UPI00340216E6|nr:hypothetical protein GCM10017745_03350 [Saccharothrix mutabilis subsp. capreolus]
MTESDGTQEAAPLPGIKIKSITLIDGSRHVLPEVGVTAIVGGNNTGKSTLLRQLGSRLQSEPANFPPPGDLAICQGLELEVSGTHEDLFNWIRANAVLQRPHKNDPNPRELYARPGTNALGAEDIQSAWPRIVNGAIPNLAPFLVSYADVGSRLGQPFNVSHRSRPGDHPTSPIHYLEDDDRLRRKLDSLFFDIFGLHLTLDKLGTTTTLRVGDEPPGLKLLTYHDNAAAVRDELDRLSPVDAQGDGMRALMGLLLPLVTATYPVIIVDEPEAFLHPPQAVKLGRILGELSRDNRVQVILATHDRNILIGLLQSNASLAVIRLTRDGNTSSSHRLEPDQIRTIWSDPVLKYSHVLDGLFHSRVVVAENERDCTFYAAALDAAHEEMPLPITPSEVLFVPTNGKDGLAPVVEALARLKVPVIASPDLDMLDDTTKMKRLLKALGREWADFQEDYIACTAPFRVSRQTPTLEHVARSIEAFLKKQCEDFPEALWDSSLRDELNSLTRVEGSPWNALKTVGTLAFPQAVSGRANKLLERLDQAGLVLVKVGELERFAHGYDVDARKGLTWLRAALQAGVHRGDAAKGHVRRFFSMQGS